MLSSWSFMLSMSAVRATALAAMEDKAGREATGLACMAPHGMAERRSRNQQQAKGQHGCTCLHAANYADVKPASQIYPECQRKPSSTT